MAESAWARRLEVLLEVCGRANSPAVPECRLVPVGEMSGWVRRVVWRRYAGRSVATRLTDRRLLRLAAATVAYALHVAAIVEEPPPALTAAEEDLLDRALRSLDRPGPN